MALPIGSTPILEGREASTFRRKIEEGLRNPTTFVSTPNLDKAKELVLKNVKRRGK